MNYEALNVRAAKRERTEIVLECQRNECNWDWNCETNQKFNIYNDDEALLWGESTFDEWN